MNKSHKKQFFWIMVAVLMLAYGLMVSSAVRKSPTVDEQSKLFRGVAYLREGATQFLLGHPLLGSSLAATMVLTEPDLQLPVDEPLWEAGNWSQAGDAFLWRLNQNPQRIIFLGRLPIIWLSLLLAALAARWGRQLGGGAAGLMGMLLLALDPNLLAHGRLVTGDMALTFFFTLTIYGYWRYAVAEAQRGGGQRPFAGWAPLIAAGLGLGAAGAVKYNAALLLPILATLGALLAWRRRSWRPLAALLVVGGVGSLLIWAFYRFAIRPLPGGAFWEDLLWVLAYFDQPHGAYLFGQSSPTGWWYYFPAAYLLKTPLPTLILLLAAVLLGTGWLWRRRRFPGTGALFLLLPPLFYLAASMLSSLNIGYRHLLPMLPFVYVGVAWTLTQTVSRRLLRAAWLLAAILPLLSVLVWPDYIPFFNRLAGGADARWRLLSDSNVDWGQDLPALAAWQQTENARPLFLSYFGTAYPSAYGIEFAPLPSWAPGPEQGDPGVQAYNPRQPAPGLYAISVTNLHGVVLGAQRELYAYFRQQEPLARLGGSIFVYEVRPTGPPQEVAFAGLRPMDLAESLHGRFSTNDLRVRWVDAGSSFLWPAQGGLLATNAAPPPALAPFWPQTAVVAADGQALYELPPAPTLDWAAQATTLDETITFLGAQRVAAAAGDLALLTAWRVEARTERPLQLFVHALDANGQIVTQWDGLGVEPTAWLPGDVMVQLHTLSLADANAAVRLVAGVYDRETLLRLGEPVVIGEP